MKQRDFQKPALCALVLLTWALSAWIRLRALPGATAGSDALGQYLAGLSWSGGALPTPPNPESGHSLWLMVWPLTHMASSLSDLFRLRFVLGATVAPLAALSAWLISPKGSRRWIAGISAGLLVALDPGLVDTLVTAFRGYGAPEFIGICTLFGVLAIRGYGWVSTAAGIALLGAIGQHPMAAGMTVGALCVIPWLAKTGGQKQLEWAIGITAIVALPRLWLIRIQTDCDLPAMDCLRQVALGSSEELNPRTMLGRAFHDRFEVELLGLWPILLVGIGMAMYEQFRRREDDMTERPGPGIVPILVFTIGGIVGILMLGTAIASLRPYHLRIAAVPLAVVAAVGLSRAWPLALAASIWALFVWGPVRNLPPSPVHPEVFDELARELAPIDGPIWVDGVYLDSPIGLDPAAVVLAAILQGQDPSRFDVGLASTVVLLINGEPEHPELPRGSMELSAGEDWKMILFPDQIVARDWLKLQQTPAAQTGGAWDWFKVLHPTNPDLAMTAWD